MKLPAHELNATHLGKTVTATHNGTTITGPLQAINHEADLIDDTQFMDNGITRWALGATSTDVTILGGHQIQLARNAEVEVAE